MARMAMPRDAHATVRASQVAMGYLGFAEMAVQMVSQFAGLDVQAPRPAPKIAPPVAGLPLQGLLQSSILTSFIRSNTRS